MNSLLLFIVHVISMCTATKILYVLPDNVSDVNCPSQPCATLGQYLLDNGSLPVLSDVEYYFLPGEHDVVNAIIVLGAVNFSLIGFGLSSIKLVCWPQSYVGVFRSYNVTIKNLVFDQCSGYAVSKFHINIVVGLFLFECFNCKVEDICCFGYGFAGVNLFLNCCINNVTIDLTIVKPAANMCSAKFSVIFTDSDSELNHDLSSVFINKVEISGYNEICYEYHDTMEILLQQSHYSMNVELRNSQFYKMNQRALYIEMTFANSSLLIKNCTFMYIKHRVNRVNQVVYGEISKSYMIVQLEDCAFHHNTVSIIFKIIFVSYNASCEYSSNIKVKNCDFSNNSGSLLMLNNIDYHCKPIVFNENIIITKNNGNFIMHYSHTSVYINGVITATENNVILDVLYFQFCDITFYNTIILLSNTSCATVIHLISSKSPYILIMEYTNITITKNTIYYQVIDLEGIMNNNAFPYCIFQYIASINQRYDLSELTTLYNISFNGNEYTTTYQYNFIHYTQNIYYFLMITHCNWISTAVFKDYNPEYINRQIVQVDGHPFINHKEVCYCPHDGEYNCTVDQLGPVYPGQLLQVDLCIPQADDSYIIIVETHAVNLPSSACQLAHQTEFINNLKNSSKTINLTIISHAYETCELFLTSPNLFHQTAFYVQLLPCPVGFILQNGKCDCDPFLPPDIDTCYIDLSAITRPANTWITAHTLTNNTTNYLISDCPMDYCLPYSTNVNLLYPDLQCQFNRTGMLCSQCQNSLSMVFASSRCMKCTNIHILITIIVIVAGIVLVVLLYVLNLTVTKGTINGIIFYANIVSINDSVFLVNDNVFKPLRVFISFTNLDLGIETCFYNGMNSYAKMWLQLFFPSYLIIIAVSIIIASRYSSRMLRLTYNRSLPVLATLFLLSYTGVLRVVLTVLFSYSTITEYPSGDKEIVWSIDASVPLFGLRFTILFITCLVLFLILIPFNVSLLFRRCLAQFRIINYFKPLLDAFQGSYKDRYYYWIAVNIILRSTFFSLYGFQENLRLFLATIILVLFSVCYGYLQPNTNKLINIQELSLLVNLTIMHIVSGLNSKIIFSVVVNLMICCGFVQFCIIILYHFFIYTFHWNISIKEYLLKLWKKRKSNSCSCDIELLNIPERTYNYSEYQDGLVSDDFK